MKNNKFARVLAILIVIGFLFPVFRVGASFARASYEPLETLGAGVKINTGFGPSVESRVIATRTIEYIKEPVTKIEYVDRVQRISTELRNYHDLEELKRWLANANTVYFTQPGVSVDCDDFALALQKKALADGYMMSFQIIEPGRYNSLFENSKIPAGSLHAINLAVIGNNAYYIEPQTGEVVLAAQLD